jgi:hypothetical protein
MTPPQIRLQNPNRPARAGLVFVAGVSVVLLGGWLARFFLETGLSWRCPSMLLFGLPCPSCGGTRALAALVQFRPLDAFLLNPLITTALALVLLAPVLKLSWEKFERWHGWTLFGAAVPLNWLYLLFFLPR